MIHGKRFGCVPAACAAVAVCAGLMATAASADAGKLVSGYTYNLNTYQATDDELGKFPPDYPDAVKTYVRQGPRHTLMWSTDMGEKRTLDNARFPRAHQSLGLFIPEWPQGRSASEDTGWKQFKKPVHYASFNTGIERGDDDRTVAGAPAKNYVLTTELTKTLESDSRTLRVKLVSHIWVLSERKFSWAPYTSGVYSDPRLTAAIAEKVAKLGMTVRVDTRYWLQEIADDGSKLGEKSRRWDIAWVSNLKSAQVPEVDIPKVDQETGRELRDAFYKDTTGNCKAVFDGQTPEFVAKRLTAEKRAYVMKWLRTRCRKYEMERLFDRLRDDPEAMCKVLGNESLPEGAGEMLTDEQQHRFTQVASRYCREHFPQAKDQKTAAGSDSKHCEDKACFQARFSECKPAAYTTRPRMGGKAEYRIAGTVDNGCRVRMIYLDNPNSAWVGKPLHMTLDSGENFAQQMKKAIKDCLTSDQPGTWQCSGALRGMAAKH